MRIFAFAGAKVRIIFELRATFADFFLNRLVVSGKKLTFART